LDFAVLTLSCRLASLFQTISLSFIKQTLLEQIYIQCVEVLIKLEFQGMANEIIDIFGAVMLEIYLSQEK